LNIFFKLYRISETTLKKMYDLKRNLYEIYNPTYLLLWGAYMDIQYIGENSLVLNRYISSYVTKSENLATQDIWDTVDSNKNLQSKLKTFALKSFKNREVGAYECADYLSI
jgi:hypothetical protein